MSNQAGFDGTERQNVYCGYCRDNNYIADIAHNLYSENCATNHKFIAAHNRYLVPYNTGKILIGIRYRPAANTAFKADNQTSFLELIEAARRERVDAFVSWAIYIMLAGVLVAAPWI